MAQTGYWTEGTNINGTNVGGGQFVSGVAPVGSKPVNTTIDGSALGNTPTLTVPKPTPTITQNPTIGVPSGAVMGADGFATLPPQPTQKTTATPEEDNRSLIQKLFKKKMDVLDTQPEVTKQIQEEEQTKQKREASISSYNAYNKANTEFNQQLQAMQNAEANTVGGVGGGYSSTIQKFEQEGRAKLANMAIQANMDQNNYQGALQNVKEKLDAQFKPVQDSIDNIVKFSQINANDLTDKEKFQLQSKVDQKKTELSNVEKTVSSLHENMLQNGAPQYLYSSVDKIVSDYSSGKITAQDAQSKLYQTVGNYGVSLQDKKIQSDISAALVADQAVTPEVLQGMLNVYKTTGVLPAFGMSAKSPLRAQFYAALGSKDGQDIINSATANKAMKAGITSAIKTQQNQLAANETAIGTLDKQLDLALQYSDKVDRSGSPILAKYLLNAKSQVFGDPDTAALNNIVTTASYEFAKILSGSAASIAGTTVSSASDAKTVLNAALAKGQFKTVVELMKKEADFRLSSQRETLKNLQSDLNNPSDLTETLKESVAPTVSNGVDLSKFNQ